MNATQQLQQALLPYRRPARLIDVEEGSPGAVPITNIGGAPWWPAGTPRPACPQGHAQSFVMQALLADIPGLPGSPEGLLSFHYCMQCTYDGHMSFGSSEESLHLLGDDPALRMGYDLRILPAPFGPSDGLGVTAEDFMLPCAVALTDVTDCPIADDIRKHAALAPMLEIADEEQQDLLSRIFAFEHDLDPVEPRPAHFPGTKLGGWPSWVQYPEYPMRGARLLLQVEGMAFDNAPWVNGTLFVFGEASGRGIGELAFVIQTT